jgi:spermidine synthase
MTMKMTSARASALAFLTAAATLFLQVLVHRMVSAKLLNNYAFLVISLTMLGFALSGVILSFFLPRFLDRLGDASGLCAALFTISVVGASMAFYRTDTAAQIGLTRPDFVAAFFRWMPFALLFAVPFACCGLILGSLLAHPDLSARRIYFADLVGSSVGALAVIPAISGVGVEASLLWACLLLLVGTLILTCPRSWLAWAAVGAAGVVLLVAALRFDRVFDLYYPDGTMLADTRNPRSGVVLEHAVWDPLARIEVSRIRPPDPDRSSFLSLIGSNRAFLARFQRMLTQNNYAYTYAVNYDGRRESLTGIEETIYSAAYHATSVAAPRVLIIGVGGGFDVLNALYFGASEITGVEVNAATVGILTRTYREYFRNWVEDPRVRLVQAEGRYFLASSDRRYDIIQLSGVDSFSGTPGAAHVFSENYLYTAEAFDLYLSRLAEDGILHMMRLEEPQPREMLRALTTAVGALRRAGVARPADHILMLTAAEGNITSLLVKRTPFRPAERARLQDWAERSPLFAVSAGPDRNEGRANAYQGFLALADPQKERAFIALYPFDISPTDDDRPFFFRFSFWWHVFPADPLIWINTPAMEYSLILLLAVISLAVWVCIYIPLRHFAGQGLRSPAAGRYGLFFAATAIGYLAIEVALLQKFGLFLGHPNYALSVVLAALLFTTGVGSLYSASLVRALGGVRFVSYALAGVVLLEHLLLIPRLPGLLSLPFGLRAGIVSLLVAPIGVCLGTFVPTALEQLKTTAPAFVPWAWGINGIFSVVAPVLAVGVSMTWGISALLLAALPIYLIVGWSLPALEAGRGSSPLS